VCLYVCVCVYNPGSYTTAEKDLRKCLALKNWIAGQQ
jgi:hypothetical protein